MYETNDSKVQAIKEFVGGSADHSILGSRHCGEQLEIACPTPSCEFNTGEWLNYAVRYSMITVCATNV